MTFRQWSTGLLTALLLAAAPWTLRAQDILIPMETGQANHLKAYGVAYWALERGIEIDWLLNYRGGSFLMEASDALQTRFNFFPSSKTLICWNRRISKVTYALL